MALSQGQKQPPLGARRAGLRSVGPAQPQVGCVSERLDGRGRRRRCREGKGARPRRDSDHQAGARGRRRSPELCERGCSQRGRRAIKRPDLAGNSVWCVVFVPVRSCRTVGRTNGVLCGVAAAERCDGVKRLRTFQRGAGVTSIFGHNRTFQPRKLRLKGTPAAAGDTATRPHARVQRLTLLLTSAHTSCVVGWVTFQEPRATQRRLASRCWRQ